MRLKQKGFSLLELILVLGIMTVIAVQDIQEKTLETQQAAARSLGSELFAFGSGFSRYLVEESQSIRQQISSFGKTCTTSGANKCDSGSGHKFVDYQYSISETPSKRDIRRLQNKQCPGNSSKGSDVGYLSCNFNGKTTVGAFPLSLRVIDRGGDLIAETKIGPWYVGTTETGAKAERNDLAALVALTASGKNADTGSSASGSSIQVYSKSYQNLPAATDPNYQLIKTTKALSGGSLYMVIDTASNSERWLRLDGTNKMTGKIEYDDTIPDAERLIKNLFKIEAKGAASALTFNGNTVETSGNSRVTGNIDVRGTLYDAAGNLYIGDNLDISGYIRNPTGNNSGRVVIADNARIDGELDVRGSIVDRAGDVNIADNVNITGTLDLYNYLRNPTSSYSGRVYVADDAQVAGNLWVNGTLFIDSISASIYYDKDNAVTTSSCINRGTNYYYVDPTNCSMMYKVFADVVYDRNNSYYQLDPSSWSRINTLYADIMYDRNNSYFYVNPASSSRLSSIYSYVMYDLNNSYYRADPAGETRNYLSETVYMDGHDNGRYQYRRSRYVYNYNDHVYFNRYGASRNYWHAGASGYYTAYGVDVSDFKVHMHYYDGSHDTTYAVPLSNYLPRFTLKGMHAVSHGSYVRKPYCRTQSGAGTWSRGKIILIPATMPIRSRSPRCYGDSWSTACYYSYGQNYVYARSVSTTYWQTYLYTYWSYPSGSGRYGYGTALTYCQNY